MGSKIIRHIYNMQCEECIELSNSIGLGKLLCDKCEYSPCSICKKIDKPLCYRIDEPEKLLILGYDDKPLCKFCLDHQCYLCGEYDGDIDWEGSGLISHHGKPVCDSCGVRNWCNQCGDEDGGCDNRCPECEAVCDAECGCEIECVKCGEEFNYNGSIYDHRNIPWDSDKVAHIKRTCSDCF